MNRLANSSIRNAILGSMIIVPLLVFILVLGIGYYYFWRSSETSTVTRMERIVEDHRRMIRSFLDEREADLEFVVNSYGYERLAEPGVLNEVLKNLQDKSKAFVDLGVFNAQGIHVAYQGPFRLAGKDYGKEDWFNQVLKDGYYISDIFLGFRRIPHFIIALSKEEKGKKWVIRATIDSYMFNDIVKSVRIGKTGEAYIINAGGQFQTERRSGGALMGREPDAIPFPSGDGIESFIKTDAKGDAYLYATACLKDNQWLLVVRQEKDDAFRDLRTAAYLIVLITIIGGAGIVGLALYVTHRIVRRLERSEKEREELSGHLIRASRLAELGEMAAGFAHEINNPLQIIKSEQALMSVLLAELKESGDLKPSENLRELEESLGQVDHQVGRCGEITGAILKFGRQSEPKSEKVDLRVFIPDVTKMIAKKASVQGIALEEDVAQDTPTVTGDPGQLQQVLLNLLNNAIDAITTRHGASGGELSLEAKKGDGGVAEIYVRDNGCGISGENQNKIFSPFFTTKPVGKGTGLGLSVCHGIIDAMGGTMGVKSEKGSGTTFTLRLPAAKP